MVHPTLGGGSGDLHLSCISGDSDINCKSMTALFLLPDPVSSQSNANNVLGMGHADWHFPSLISLKCFGISKNIPKNNCWSVVIEKETEAQRDGCGPEVMQ